MKIKRERDVKRKRKRFEIERERKRERELKMNEFYLDFHIGLLHLRVTYAVTLDFTIFFSSRLSPKSVSMFLQQLSMLF